MGQKTMILAIAIIIFTVILSILLIISHIHGGPKKPEVVEDTTSSEVTTRNLVPVNDIITNPMVYNGYKLEVDSQITGWGTNKSFFFTGGSVSTFGGGPRKRLLVIAKEPFQLPQDPDDDKVGLGETAKITATGTVQVMNKEQLQAALGVNLNTGNQSSSSANLYDKTLTQWKVGPVLLLDTIIVTANTK